MPTPSLAAPWPADYSAEHPAASYTVSYRASPGILHHPAGHPTASYRVSQGIPQSIPQACIPAVAAFSLLWDPGPSLSAGARGGEKWCFRSNLREQPVRIIKQINGRVIAEALGAL